MKFEWEHVCARLYQNGKDNDDKMWEAEKTERLCIHGGWLVKHTYHNNHGHCFQNIIFTADPKHEWEVEKD